MKSFYRLFYLLFLTLCTACKSNDVNPVDSTIPHVPRSGMYSTPYDEHSIIITVVNVPNAGLLANWVVAFPMQANT